MFHDESFDINKLAVGQEVWVRTYRSVEYHENVRAFGWRAEHYEGGVDINSVSDWKKGKITQINLGTRKPYKGKRVSFGVDVFPQYYFDLHCYAGEGAFEHGDSLFVIVSTVQPPSREEEEEEAKRECGVLEDALKSAIDENLGIPWEFEDES